MLMKFKNSISKELSHLKKLSPDVRKLLFSYIFFTAAYPLLSLFINAYLWRSGDSLDLIIAYNLFFSLGLPIGFVINGLLLRHINIKTLYPIGALSQGLVALLVVFMPSGSVATLSFYGLLYGMGSALYWGNSNFLQQTLTTSDVRLYFRSLQSLAFLIFNTITPFLAGLLISFGPISGLYELETGYQIVMVIAMILLTLCGYVVYSSKINDLVRPKLFIEKSNKYWNMNRAFVAINDLFIGVYSFLPSILLLSYAGNEGVLGSVQALGALLTVVVIYLIGRKLNEKYYFKILVSSWLLLFVGSLFLALDLNWFTVIAFLLVASIAYELKYVASWPVMMDLIDDETGKDPLLKYAYLTDNEIFFNLGRIVAVNIFVVLLVLFSEEVALSYASLIIVMIMLLSLLLVKKILQREVAPVDKP